MRGKSARGWRRVEMPAERMEAVKTLMQQAGPLLGKGDPIMAHAFFDRTDRPRRVHATFADGWRATLVLYSDGTGALSQALKITGEIRGVLA